MAATPMRELTESVRESCHLGILHGGALLVLHQEESPQKLRLSIEVGGRFPLLDTVSGRLLLAYLSPEARAEILSSDGDFAALSIDGQARLDRQLQVIRTRGYEEAQSETTEGVADLAVLVGVPEGTIQAALTIAWLGRKNGPRKDDLLPVLRHCAATIGRSAGLIL
jgi:DNA-binding IclR family transcriptional regulator